MIYDLFVSLVRDLIFIVSTDKFFNASHTRFIDRYTGKHPLLVPELIVVNDQPFGFKRAHSHLKTLEKLPIYCELECITEAEDDPDPLIESLDLFSEVTLPLHHKVAQLQSLCDLFSQYIYVERVKPMTKTHDSTLLIYSKLGNLFTDRFFDDEIEDHQLTEEVLEQMFQDYLTYFIQFIKVFDEIFFQDIPLDEIDPHLLP